MYVMFVCTCAYVCACMHVCLCSRACVCMKDACMHNINPRRTGRPVFDILYRRWIYFLPSHPEWFCFPLRLPYSVFWEFVSWRKGGRSVNLAAFLRLVLMLTLRMSFKIRVFSTFSWCGDEALFKLFIRWFWMFCFRNWIWGICGTLGSCVKLKAN